MSDTGTGSAPEGGNVVASTGGNVGASAGGTDIGNLKYGTSTSGTEEYVEKIRGIVLQDAAEYIRDVKTIQSICDDHWEGKAKDNFKLNLQKHANYVADEFSHLFTTLQNEVKGTNGVMIKNDENLIQPE